MMFKRFLNRLRDRASETSRASTSTSSTEVKTPKRTIHLTTCVWGAQHLDVMEKVTWPTLLSENNLPYLARYFDTKYFISTTESDYKVIVSWPIFRRIAALVEIEWTLVPEAPSIEYHVQWYRRSVDVARESSALCALIYSDVAWCDGTFRRCVQALAEGKIGITAPYIRTVSETCLPEMAAMARKDEVLSLDRAELVRIGIRHMHPLTAAANAKGRHTRPSLEAIWRVPEQGILLRQMARETFLIDTARLNPNRFWYPGNCKIEDLHIGSGDDDILILSFADMFKDIETFIPEHTLTSLDLALMSLHPVNDTSVASGIARIPLNFAYAETGGSAWPRLLEESSNFISQSIRLRGYLRVWQCAQEAGCARAARLIGTALHVTAIAEEWEGERAVTVVVPEDEAFQIDEYLQDGIIREKSWDYLKILILRHVIPGPITLPMEGRTIVHNALHQPLSIELDETGRYTIGGAHVRRVIDIDPHRVMIVDRSIAPQAVVDEPGPVRPEFRKALPSIEPMIPRLVPLDDFDDQIAGDYGLFLREFEVDLGDRKMDHVRQNAASALLQAGQIRQQANLLSEIMADFERDRGPADPISAFSDALLCVVGERDRLLEASRSYYELSLRMEPDCAEACYGLALIEARLGRHREASELFARAGISNSHPHARDGGSIKGRSLYERARVELKLANTEGATSYFRESLSYLMSFGIFNKDYADLIAGTDSIKEAIDQYNRATYYSHIISPELVSPAFSADEELPRTDSGRISDPFRLNKISKFGEHDVYYWWHIYLLLPSDFEGSSSSDLLRYRTSGGRLRAAVSADLLT